MTNYTADIYLQRPANSIRVIESDRRDGAPIIYNVVREMTYKLRLKKEGEVGNLGNGNSRNNSTGTAGKR